MTTATQRTTAYATLDFLVRDWLPYWLDAANLAEHADSLRSLDPITDDATVYSTRASAWPTFQAVTSMLPSGPGPDLSELLDCGNQKERASGISDDANKLLHSVLTTAHIGASLYVRSIVLDVCLFEGEKEN